MHALANRSSLMKLQMEHAQLADDSASSLATDVDVDAAMELAPSSTASPIAALADDAVAPGFFPAAAVAAVLFLFLFFFFFYTGIAINQEFKVQNN